MGGRVLLEYHAAVKKLGRGHVFSDEARAAIEALQRRFGRK